MRIWRVYLDGVLLNDIPSGLNKFTREFVRDNELFGIYSVSSFDLTFSGDGYCILKDFQDNVDSCEKTIRVDKYCKGWSTIFNGVINVGSVEIDEENSVATCEIEDNSPLALISRNAEVTIDLESTFDIFGNAVTPCTFGTYALGTPTNNSAYTADGVTWEDAIRMLLESITGVNVNVSSTYLDLVPLPTIYTLTYTGNLADITSTTIVFKNFQGVTQTIVANFQSGTAHLAEVGKRLLSSSQFLATNQGLSNTMELNDDYRNFYLTSEDGTAKSVTAYCNLPIEIISATADSIGAPITISVVKTQEFVDGGNSPVFFNYRSIKNQASPYLFVTSFKEMMETLHKEYNVLFLATYNALGGIDFVIEDYQYFANAGITYTFDNAKNLKSSYDEEQASKSISVGDSSNTTLANKSYTFTTEFCGLGGDFEAGNSFILGSVQIWKDLAATFEDGKESVIYMIDKSGEMASVQWTNDNYIITTKYNGFVYNLYLTNWHKVYRHLNKFKNNVIGIAPYFDFDTIDYSVNVTNTAENRLFRLYEFNETMTNDQFNGLSDNIIDKARFKRTSQTTYRTGLIKSVSYDYETGKAEIIILGE